jgi:hypothetical protein
MSAMMKQIPPMIHETCESGCSFFMVTAISVASKPNKVVNLMIGFIATELVSLNGSPTVSPTTVAA